MEAADVTAQPEPTPVTTTEWGPLRRGFAEAGELAAFSLRALAELRGVWMHFGEILRQTRILIVGTTGLIVFLMLAIGAMVAIFGNFFFRSLGASDALGLFTAIGVSREGVPLMFGWAFAAKVGSGIAAEVGSMKVGEELDAFRSVGLDPMRFVVATRLVAAVLFVIVVFGLAVAAANLGSFLTVVLLIGEVSQGSFEAAHWALQSPHDQLVAFFKVLLIAITIVIVSSFHGYRVHGGPAEVGNATARSMVLNLVLINVIDAALSALFYGADVRLPIGG